MDFEDAAWDGSVSPWDAAEGRDGANPADGDGGAVCGNGRAEAEEVCDGTDLRGLTCESLGLGGGTLACSEDCSRLVVSGCERTPPCGNGVLDQGEGCDDGNHDNTDSCPDDVTRGGTCQPARCGDGFVWAGHEECDDGPANSDTEPDACRTDCRAARCGDGVRDSAEECDGADFGGETCESLVWGHGDLVCGSQCEVDTTQCLERAVGAPCESDDVCTGGVCWVEDRGFPGGYCTAECETSPCPEGAVCRTVADGGLMCLDRCDDGTSCRDDYECHSVQHGSSYFFICWPL